MILAPHDSDHREAEGVAEAALHQIAIDEHRTLRHAHRDQLGAAAAEGVRLRPVHEA